MIQEFNRIEKVSGQLELQGDKSISHRSVMFAALAKGESKIYNLSNGDDVKSTQNCFKQLGIEIENKNRFVKVKGNGFKGFRKPSVALDAGNSGTTARLISGILIAQEFDTIIIGDESLSKRPMKRIITPLSAMGGRITAAESFTLPLNIFPVREITAIDYELPVASAQVKSAVLLAGLHSEQITSVIEKKPSRDHTERMLGLKTVWKEGRKTSFASKENYPEPAVYQVPADISTAAFFIVLGLLAKDSSLRILNVSLNETRIGVINILKEMGGHIEIENIKEMTGEPFGDINVYSSQLKNIDIKEEIIPNIIDEIPVLSIAGIFAEGKFKIKNAVELRGKETDRIYAVCHNLKLLGINVEEFEDGFEFEGNLNIGKPVFESFKDHRIAMAFAVLSLLLKNGGKVNDFDCVNISNPNFIMQLNSIIK